MSVAETHRKHLSSALSRQYVHILEGVAGASSYKRVLAYTGPMIIECQHQGPARHHLRALHPCNEDLRVKIAFQGALRRAATRAAVTEGPNETVEKVELDWMPANSSLVAAP